LYTAEDFWIISFHRDLLYTTLEAVAIMFSRFLRDISLVIIKRNYKSTQIKNLRRRDTPDLRVFAFLPL